MFSTTIAKVTAPNLGWTRSEPGLLAIIAGALRKPAGKPTGPSAKRRFAKPQLVPFTWL